MSTRPTSVRPGSSYIVLSSTSSRIARRPRAPVPRSSAWSAMASSAVAGELELDVFELEHLAVLLDERVLRLGEDLDQRVAVEAAHRADHRQAADELGDHPELDEVLRQHLGEQLAGIAARPCERTVPWKPTPLWPMRLSMICSSPANAPPQMNRTLVVSIWMNSWCGCLRPPWGGTDATRAFEDLEQRLLHALAATRRG